jgi:hypothetical protein
MEGIRITQLRRDEDGGYWTARLHNGDVHLDVHCQFGSWLTYPDKKGIMRDVLPLIAAELTARMRAEEGREKRAQEKLAETNPFVRKATQNGGKKVREVATT